MTRQAFIEAYRAELVAAYPWATQVMPDGSKRVDTFLASVETTLAGTHSTWNHDGECVTAAWRAIGGKGKPTLKALRGLK